MYEFREQGYNFTDSNTCKDALIFNCTHTHFQDRKLWNASASPHFWGCAFWVRSSLIDQCSSSQHSLRDKYAGFTGGISFTHCRQYYPAWPNGKAQLLADTEVAEISYCPRTKKEKKEKGEIAIGWFRGLHSSILPLRKNQGFPRTNVVCYELDASLSSNLFFRNYCKDYLAWIGGKPFPNYFLFLVTHFR